MKLLINDSPAGTAPTPPPPAAPASAAAPVVNVDIAADIKKIQALIDAWKTAKATGQLHIAIGGLNTAIEYAQHHLNLAPAPAAAPVTK